MPPSFGAAYAATLCWSGCGARNTSTASWPLIASVSHTATTANSLKFDTAIAIGTLFGGSCSVGCGRSPGRLVCVPVAPIRPFEKIVIPSPVSAYSVRPFAIGTPGASEAASHSLMLWSGCALSIAPLTSGSQHWPEPSQPAVWTRSRPGSLGSSGAYATWPEVEPYVAGPDESLLKKSGHSVPWCG